MKVGEALDSYAEHLLLRAKESTARVAGCHLRKLKADLGYAEADYLTTEALDRYVARLKKRGLKDTSINGSLRVLRAALKLAEENRHIKRAPKVKLLREPRKIPRVLSRVELGRVYNQLRSYHSVLMLYLAADAGLRKGEIQNLQRQDLDLRGRLVYVRCKAYWRPKSHAERAVPMSERLHYHVNMETPAGYKPDDLVFPSNVFDPALRAVMGAIKNLDGITQEDKPGLHMLRRSFATRLLQNGTDIETVRELGGWADLVTVQRYLGSDAQTKVAAVRGLWEDTDADDE